MKILILGGDGMLGHQLLRQLQARHETRVTLRQDLDVYRRFGLFTRDNAYSGVDVRSLERVIEVLADFRPQVVINAVGVVKQRPTAGDSIPSIEINALLPHRLAVVCRGVNARLVHISTDCVFSGRKGGYIEDDPADADDLYGKSKFLGELHDTGCITLRTSIIGRELDRRQGLLEWFLAQHGAVKGFRKAIFSGLTTIELARVIEKVLTGFPDLSGLYHVSSSPISKHDLLLLFRDVLGHSIEIVPDDAVQSDRSLDSTRFRTIYGYARPSWPAMIEELRSGSGRQ